MARSKKSMLIVGGVVLGIALVAGLFGFIKFTDGQNFDPPQTVSGMERRAVPLILFQASQ